MPVNLDLVTFVKEAIEAEIGAGRALAERPDGVLELQLPPEWTFGLDNLPGYDLEFRILRLTRDRQRLQDAQGRTLGFLGRAHPLVRRAIDRVRRVESAAGDALLDRRVTAALADAGSEPSLIYTFSAAISSEAGTEYQRIIAATVSRDRPPLPNARSQIPQAAS